LGFAIARVNKSELFVDHILLKDGDDAGVAVFALASVLPIDFVQVRIDRPSIDRGLRQ